MRHTQPSLWAGVALVVVALAACTRAPGQRWGEGLDVAQIPGAVRADYAVFATRCSKCHSLSRALNSGIDQDAFWALYVARMRRQPASGISPEDEVVILRFLHYFALELRRSKAAAATEGRLEAPALAPGGTL